jgi:hypothetical protein
MKFKKLIIIILLLPIIPVLYTDTDKNQEDGKPETPPEEKPETPPEEKPETPPEKKPETPPNNEIFKGLTSALTSINDKLDKLLKPPEKNRQKEAEQTIIPKIPKEIIPDEEVETPPKEPEKKVTTIYDIWKKIIVG